MFNSRLSKVTSLLERGANPNIRDPHTTHTPIFHLAAALEAFQTDFYFAGWCPVLRQDVDSLYQEVIVPYALEFLKLLVKHGADPTIPCEGTTALHLVCKISSRYESIINMLLKSGADINAPNSNGETPIFSMVDRPPGDMKKLVTFMYKGAKCNHQNHDGRTPMHAVILNNGSRAKKQSVIRTLINFGGADASIKDNNGESPADVGEGLRVREWFETLDMLRFAEENPQARALTDDDLMDTRYRKNRRSD
ncbi:ankyrin repeat-containing domain protein [Hypoxylon crocopeplum]|nr:ankyrin repeat-containing domain protein [Hypoxylon crocopeplum]